MKDELGMDTAQLADVGKSMLADATSTPAPDPVISSDSLDSDIKVENTSFWGDDEEVQSESAASESADSDDDLLASDDEDDMPSDSSSIISYKVKGKEVQIDLESLRNDPTARQKLADDLALVEGAKQAVTKAGTQLKEKRRLEKTAAELAEYKKAWDKLEAIREDDAKVFEVITGKSLDEVLAERAEKSYRYQNASEEEKKIMEYEDRIRQMELRTAREEVRRAEELAELSTKKYEADKRSLATDLKTEAAKYEFANVDPAKANRLQKMLWQSAIDDIKTYTSQGYKFNEKMVAKAFRDNAAALEGFYKSSVKNGVKDVVTKKRAVAAEQAAAAATRNYKQPDFNSLVGKNPMDIFNALRRRK